MNDELQEMLDSIINGQRMAALKQLQSSSYYFEDLMEYMKEQGYMHELITLVKVAINNDILIEN